ncbi:soluble guanylate cyclase 88E-like isoform X2 [Lineus longissimus]|uniref:soluble guanylate cyclase 88E-like isoform X2 n=1 Tax=Lineus longissimus TaxID=88925 RepID=UPI00315C50FB
MYGLLFEGMQFYVKKEYGDDAWEAVLRKADLSTHTFSSHKTYNENLLPKIAEAAVEVLEVTKDEFMFQIGKCFVAFVGQYGYDGILKVLGRHLRDFLNGLDNLHEYLRFSYPKLKPPSFFCVNESKTGLTLHYRSKRKGYLTYVTGQIMQVAKQFYNTDLRIEIVNEEVEKNLTNAILRLHFDNRAYRKSESRFDFTVIDSLPVPSEVFFEVFPFNIVFNRGMKVRNIGDGVQAVMPNLLGAHITSVFRLTKPLVEFTWESVMMHTNNIFEMTSHSPVGRLSKAAQGAITNGESGDIEEMGENDDDFAQRQISEAEEVLIGRCLRLKGQMMYMNDWDSIIFLGTPVMNDISAMFNAGLYINDLSMHDSSRDLILAGTQQSAELKLALDQEQQKSKKLEDSMKKLDMEMKRTDQLLYQMIPKSVADRLRSGEAAMNTCETFESVTVLFSDVVGFTSICSKISPLEVVTMLNAMYTKFDQLSEVHKVYKVETIGDAYMVVSGAPTVTRFHAQYICDMALDMVLEMTSLADPSTGDHLSIRVGAHSGMVVAGVVGLKMPRYCLFGDTVNTASRMESNSAAQKIHISETVKLRLEGFPYMVKERGTTEVKGKGTMKTYWLERRLETEPDDRNTMLMQADKLRMDKNTSASQSNINAAHDTFDRRSLYSPVVSSDVSRPGSSTNVSLAANHEFQPKSQTKQTEQALQTLTRTDAKNKKSYKRWKRPLIKKQVALSLGFKADLLGKKSQPWFH